jgi:HD-GYP domain-containing protein (c-di-GMP phosphodiesterase class II)
MTPDYSPAERVLRGLTRAMRNVSFYSPDHPVVQADVEATAVELQYLVTTEEFTLKLVAGEVVAGDQPLRLAGAGSLLGACRRREIESLTFLPGLTTEELAQLITLLALEPDELAEVGGSRNFLLSHGAEHVLVERLHEVDGGPAGSDPREGYVRALDVLRGAFRQANMGGVLDLKSAEATVHELVDAVVTQSSAMLGLTSVKSYDEYTFVHALHVCLLSLEMGRGLELSRPQLEELGLATLLHDTGKIFIPLELLRKPGRLTDAEFAVIQRHPVDGALLLSREEGIPEAVPLVAYEHHMHGDLSGYPAPTGPRQLHLYSLMAGLTDVYDALTTERPYRASFSPARALAVMHGSDVGHFDPRLLAAFTEMLGDYPPGSVIRLDTGEVAVVSRPNPESPNRPLVRLLDRHTARPTLSPEEVALSSQTVVECLDPADSFDVAELLREVMEDKTG